MTRSYRNSWKIILDILKCASSEEVKKTHIMYRANLNYVSFHRLFPVLVDQGYIVEVGDPEGGVLYRTSEKGMALVRVLSEVETKIPRKGRLRKAILLC